MPKLSQGSLLQLGCDQGLSEGGMAKSTNLEPGLGTSQLGLSEAQFLHLQNHACCPGLPKSH